MKRDLLLHIIVLLIGYQSAQAQFDTPHRPYGTFEPGETVLLFGDRVNLRDAPHTQGKVVAQLPLAQLLRVQSIGASAMINGLNFPWLEIETEWEGRTQRGWLWSGLVSHLSRKGNQGEWFLLGASSAEGDEITTELRVVKDGALLAQLAFPAIGELGHYLELKVSGGHSVPGVLHLIQPSFAYEACGYTNGEANIFWDGRKLHDLGHTRNWADAGFGYMFEEYRMPDHGEGLPDRILWIKEESKNDEMGNGVMTRTTKALHWNGTRLVDFTHEDLLNSRKD
ncbi:hypothetical protein [Flavilitoribacter nigricans]|uniref:SH3 domain-containing protein n=1 Tax=Flavilitoribacter nigricans (strain ATCC 23147 / DSM 23189 / NBRC 102662 / NCIMB 1420 / SS-2) TaxID=1122177 RepID=A0A2D0NFA2_FLAN2|nr:hypothetical protein [Flavilitoribacter nigricans]PHN07060.1 hypothetical protein CRP01_07460 [Flavilitoribacter nigricans DSM 23189 = NBRC 102662]